ncbi:hypothetical protein [Streptomyces sp. NPDC048361]|uniref:hypothetical protein n=1 Tax=Streptomyces sp. NPDC048361 TaxID=3154720 RepID=UPI00343EF126
MTPYSLAFYLDVITTGTVLGAKPTDTPDRVTDILGAGFAENSFDKHSMWRDYGMAEFFWDRRKGQLPWKGHHFTLQVHRLPWGGETVNSRVRERYGRFERHLRFDRLEQLLGRRGVHLEDVPDANAPDYSLHWQPSSQVAVMVRRTPEEGGRRRGRSRVGDVHAIYSSLSADMVAWHRSHYGSPDR